MLLEKKEKLEIELLINRYLYEEEIITYDLYININNSILLELDRKE